MSVQQALTFAPMAARTHQDPTLALADQDML